MTFPRATLKYCGCYCQHNNTYCLASPLCLGLVSTHSHRYQFAIIWVYAKGGLKYKVPNNTSHYINASEYILQHIVIMLTLQLCFAPYLVFLYRSCQIICVGFYIGNNFRLSLCGFMKDSILHFTIIRCITLHCLVGNRIN